MAMCSLTKGELFIFSLAKWKAAWIRLVASLFSSHAFEGAMVGLIPSVLVYSNFITQRHNPLWFEVFHGLPKAKDLLNYSISQSGLFWKHFNPLLACSFSILWDFFGTNNLRKHFCFQFGYSLRWLQPMAPVLWLLQERLSSCRITPPEAYPGYLGYGPEFSWEGIAPWRIHAAHALEPCTIAFPFNVHYLWSPKSRASWSVMI